MEITINSVQKSLDKALPGLVILKFIKRKATILVRDLDGFEYIVRREVVLRGAAPTIQTAVEKEKLLQYKVFNNTGNKIKVVGKYINGSTKILIEDALGIQYLILPSNLLSNKSISIKGAVDKTMCFITKAKDVHGDVYKYASTIYTGALNKLSIICKIHGEFKQEASSHLKGMGCEKCAIQGGRMWPLDKWKKYSSLSSFFESFKVYIIKCNGNGEEFIKIGRTYSSLQRRFGAGNTAVLPYTYKVLKTIEGDAKYIYNLELMLHEKYKNNKYYPELYFSGETECFLPTIKIEEEDN